MQQSGAATIPVANGDVAGLASAITTANSNAEDDTIVLATAGTYTLTSALPQIGADGGHKLTIQGNGSTLQRSTAVVMPPIPNFRIFTTQSGSNVTIAGLTMANGNPGAAHGGAIFANFQETAASILTIDSCVFNNNQGDYGGAIWNDGYNDPSFPAHTATLTVTNSTFSNNTGTQYGGAIWNESGGIVMNVSNCTFSHNTAVARDAGAIQFDGSTGSATGSISNCTFTQNSAAHYGGAINVDGDGGLDFFGNPTSGSATLTVTNCTFDRNTANWGGGIAMDGSNDGGTTGNATVNVNNCTFSQNLSNLLGDAIYLSETTAGTTVLRIGNSILKSTDPDFNISTDNISGGTVTVISNGNSLSDDAACGVDPCNDAGTGPGGLLNHAGDIRNTDPLLDVAGLQNNGGPTLTIALQVTSPAINHGNDANAPAQDQRYYLRNGQSDIGAFEFGGTLAPADGGSAMMHGAAGSFSINLPLTGNVGIECRSGGTTGDHQLGLNFATPVTVNGNPQAQVTTGIGNIGSSGVSNGGVVTVSGKTVTIPLTNVTNAQRIVVTLFNVSDGVHTNNVSIPMGVLEGDTNADTFVDSADIAQTKSKSGQVTNTTNFREDVNEDGFLDSADIGFVKSKSGTAIPSAAPATSKAIHSDKARSRSRLSE